MSEARSAAVAPVANRVGQLSRVSSADGRNEIHARSFALLRLASNLRRQMLQGRAGGDPERGRSSVLRTVLYAKNVNGCGARLKRLES
jgi:hypothetical protein